MTIERTLVEIPRDRWKRPLIIPLGGGPPVAYPRVSTICKTLDDTTNLAAWGKRKVAEGMLRRPDLVTRVAGVLANGDPDTDRSVKRELDEICEEATTAAGATKGRSAGTGFHGLTEAIDRGEEPLYVPDADRPRLDAYRDTMAAYSAVDVETFIVQDEVRAAGTFDRLLMCPDGRVRVADLKSGKWEAQYPFSTCVQVSIYSHGKRYDPETGARTHLHPDLDLDVGLLIHMPPTGGCFLYELNLTHGWKAARLARAVYDMRALKTGDLVREVAP